MQCVYNCDRWRHPQHPPTQDVYHQYESERWIHHQPPAHRNHEGRAQGVWRSETLQREWHHPTQAETGQRTRKLEYLVPPKNYYCSSLYDLVENRIRIFFTTLLECYPTVISSVCKDVKCESVLDHDNISHRVNFQNCFGVKFCINTDNKS